MKRFGTTHLDKAGCRCCTSVYGARAKVKQETLKLIKEDQDDVVYLGHTLPKSETSSYCGVCGDYQNPECATEC